MTTTTKPFRGPEVTVSRFPGIQGEICGSLGLYSINKPRVFGEESAGYNLSTGSRHIILMSTKGKRSISTVQKDSISSKKAKTQSEEAYNAAHVNSEVKMATPREEPRDDLESFINDMVNKSSSESDSESKSGSDSEPEDEETLLDREIYHKDEQVIKNVNNEDISPNVLNKNARSKHCDSLEELISKMKEDMPLFEEIMGELDRIGTLEYEDSMFNMHQQLAMEIADDEQRLKMFEAIWTPANPDDDRSINLTAKRNLRLPPFGEGNVLEEADQKLEFHLSQLIFLLGVRMSRDGLLKDGNPKLKEYKDRIKKLKYTAANMIRSMVAAESVKHACSHTFSDYLPEMCKILEISIVDEESGKENMFQKSLSLVLNKLAARIPIYKRMCRGW